MKNNEAKTKYIFVTGGVVSSLGKGIIAASLGALLETRALKVIMTKVDPYLNIDPGTMNPAQHGEVFVTEDGAETDLDIGHYERFTSATMTKLNSFSAGQIYDTVLSKERNGSYFGGTVQVIPHITDQIKENIFKASKDVDISIVEIGGTVGDIEGLPFIEAIRQIKYDLGDENVLYIHLTLVPYLKAARELKTKPTQHSVTELRKTGVQPDILVCRSEHYINNELRSKIASFCNVQLDSVICSEDMDSIYQIPLTLHKQNFDQLVVNKLNIWAKSPDLSAWEAITKSLEKPIYNIKVCIVGKYVDVWDSYKSINEALIHAGLNHKTNVDIDLLDSEQITQDNVKEKLHLYDAVIVPGGFGTRGIEGKINTIKYIRENNIPFLGICLGMQVAAVEFARNVLKIKNANSEEFSSSVKNSENVIHVMEDQKYVKQIGGTMRLGAYPCVIKPDSLSFKIYNSKKISERHRHRYEFNNQYREQYEKHGMQFSGLSPDNSLIEIMELKKHPWFVAVQFHPELKSQPTKPHPLFYSFIKIALEKT